MLAFGGVGKTEQSEESPGEWREKRDSPVLRSSALHGDPTESINGVVNET
jgi:hypothetical protein